MNAIREPGAECPLCILKNTNADEEPRLVGAFAVGILSGRELGDLHLVRSMCRPHGAMLSQSLAVGVRS